MNDTQSSHPLLSRRDKVVHKLPHKELVEELRTQWKNLWRERIDDRVRAEGVANKDYSKLFIEKGTVIFATRNCQLPDFGDILKLNSVNDPNRFASLSPHTGGWGKFIKTTISRQKPPEKKSRDRQLYEVERSRRQAKKGGRGWLHS